MNGLSSVAIGSDHAGFRLKKIFVEYLKNAGIECKDFGTDGDISVDYPDFAALVAQSVVSGASQRGILICSTGIGMSIAANRFKGIRAALCHDCFTAKMSRRHNDSNILVIGAGLTAAPAAKDILETWLSENFEGGRHERRICKIDI